MTNSPSYEELKKRLFYTRYVQGPDGEFVVYWTYTGSIKTSCNWLVPGTEA